MLGLLAVVIAAALAAGIYVAVGTSAAPPHPPAHRSGHSLSSSARTSPAIGALAPHPAGRIGDYPVTERSFVFTEHRGGTLGARELHVSVHYPGTGSVSTASGSQHPFPLVVFAPGYTQCSTSYNDLLRQWASAGYVVAAVNFPRTNCHVAGPDESDLVNQPADVAYVIRRLAQMSGGSAGPLSGLIDSSRVAIAGHSDGGDTVAAMAAMSCCRYPRLRAVIVLAGAEWPAFAGRWFAAPTPPMLFVQGTADAINPQTASLQMYTADKTGVRFYLQLAGANHLRPYEGRNQPEPVVARVTIAFLDHYLAGDGVPIGAMRGAGDVAGVSQLVSGGHLP